MTKKTIFIAGDHNFLRDAISHLFAKSPAMEGYKIISVPQCPDALFEFQKLAEQGDTPAVLVIASHNIPEGTGKMTGLQLSAAIRETHKDMPIVMVATADDIKDRAEKAGATHLFTKDPDNSLLDIVEDVARRAAESSAPDAHVQRYRQSKRPSSDLPTH